MRSALYDPACFHHIDAVSVPDCSQPMRDDDDCPALGQASQPLLDEFLVFWIRCRSGLVED